MKSLTRLCIILLFVVVGAASVLAAPEPNGTYINNSDVNYWTLQHMENGNRSMPQKGSYVYSSGVVKNRNESIRMEGGGDFEMDFNGTPTDTNFSSYVTILGNYSHLSNWDDDEIMKMYTYTGAGSCLVQYEPYDGSIRIYDGGGYNVKGTVPANARGNNFTLKTVMTSNDCYVYAYYDENMTLATECNSNYRHTTTEHKLVFNNDANIGAIESICVDNIYATYLPVRPTNDTEAPAGDEDPPTVTILAPDDRVRNESNPISVNFQSNEDGNCSLRVNDTWYNSTEVSASTETWLNFSTDTGGSHDYFVNVSCNDSSGNQGHANMTVEFDDLNPTITTLGGHDVATDNSTIINKSDTSTMSLNVTFADTNLYQTLVNLTNDNGSQIIYANETLDLNSSSFNINTTISTLNMSIGNYTLYLSASDDHTAKSIPAYDYNYDFNKKSIIFNTYEGNMIEVTPIDFHGGVKSFNVVKEEDRYKYDYSFISPGVKTFRLQSDGVITYRSHYDYPSFVVYKSGTGNWIDFKLSEDMNPKYNVIKVDDYTYDIDIDIKSLDMNFNSIGGLNTYSETYSFQIVNTTWRNSSNVSNGSSGSSNESSGSSPSGPTYNFPMDNLTFSMKPVSEFWLDLGGMVRKYPWQWFYLVILCTVMVYFKRK